MSEPLPPDPAEPPTHTETSEEPEPGYSNALAVPSENPPPAGGEAGTRARPDHPTAPGRPGHPGNRPPAAGGPHPSHPIAGGGDTETPAPKHGR